MVDINLILAEHQTLETERLILRKLQLEDATEMFNYASNPEVVRYTSFEPHDSVEITKSTIANFFCLMVSIIGELLKKLQDNSLGKFFLILSKKKLLNLVGF